VACTIISYRCRWHKPLNVASATLLRSPTSEPSHETRPDGAAALADPQAQQVYQPPKAICYEEPRRISNFRLFFHRDFVDNGDIFDTSGIELDKDPAVPSIADDRDYLIPCKRTGQDHYLRRHRRPRLRAINLAAWDLSFPSSGTDCMAREQPDNHTTRPLHPSSLWVLFTANSFVECLVNDCVQQVNERP
jgi:hypothetical protein